QPTQFIDPVTGNEYFITVRMADRFRSHVADLEDISIRTPAGNLVSLASIAKVKRSSGPVLINRKYLQRIIDVTANVAPGKDLGSASAAVERALRDLRPPEGFSAGLSGQAQAQKEAFSGLSLAALMAIAIGEGSETNLPLARAVIGGLTVSTFFTLFLVPALYSIADRWRKPHPAEEEEDVAHAPA